MSETKRKVWEGELYPFRKITAMGMKGEERAVPKGYVVVTFTSEQWIQLPQDIREKILDNSVSDCYE
jgi:hypothetical protein